MPASFPDASQTAATPATGRVLLAQTIAELLAATERSGDIYFVHRERAELEEGLRQLAERRVERPVLCFQGSVEELRQALPPAGLPAWLFRRLREAQQGDPRAWLTTASRWRRANESPAGEWPYAAHSTPLPETMPDGRPWPLISIVTPSFNQGAFLEETILSVAGQGYPHVEHIVIDGGSTDETAAVLARHRDKLAVAVMEKDRGQSHAINKGMALAKGEILTWLNSDDLLAPGALAAAAMAFHLSGADLIAGMVTLRESGKTVGHHMTSCEPGPLPLDELLDLEGGWHAGQFFYQPEVLFTRAVWERAGGSVREDLHYSMDYDLWVRMAEAGAKLHVIGHTVAWFRIHAAQKTSAVDGFRGELQRYVDDYYQRTGRARRPSGAFSAPRRSLRITLFNDHGYKKGAGIAHQRLAETLAWAGHTVSARSLWSKQGFSEELTPLTAEEVATAVERTVPDLVVSGNLHAVGQDSDQIRLLSERFPTLAVLHDFWLLTGRCAYPGPCEKYKTGCDATCPTADEHPRLAPALIAGAWAKKHAMLSGENRLMILGNSDWACGVARSAMPGGSGRPVARFRLAFPMDVFRPMDRGACRAALGLPEDRFIVLLSGDLYDPRKNTRLALDALAALGLVDLTVVSLGPKRDGETFTLPDVRRPGEITDPEEMAAYYAAADLYVGPSREETFGQVFIESIACGTPVIGLHSSGMCEAVVEGLTGLLAREDTAESLGSAIRTLYADRALRCRMAQWGAVHVRNEWSAAAAYYHLFRAWRQLGLLERLRLPPKIGFTASLPAAPECRPIAWSEPYSLEPSAMGPEEGPFPELGLPQFRWAYGPASAIRVHSGHAGPHSLVIRYRNVLNGQRMGLALNGIGLGSFSLATTGLEKGRLLCVRAELQKGSNELRMEFTKWSDPERDGRAMAVAITEVRFLPEVRA